MKLKALIAIVLITVAVLFVGNNLILFAKDDRGKTSSEEYANDEKRNVILIGDSYARREYSDWVGILKKKLEADKRFGGIYTKRMGGAGFNEKSRVLFTDLLKGVSVSSHEDVTDVVVLGGYNDCSGTKEQIMKGIEDFIHYSNESYPNAQVHIGCVATTSMTDVNTYAMTHIENYILPAYHSSVMLGARYITNSEYILRNADFLTEDGIHPNGTAGPYVAGQIYQYLIGGEVDVFYSSMIRLYNAQSSYIARLSLVYHNGKLTVSRVDRDQISYSSVVDIKTDVRGGFAGTIGTWSYAEGNYRPITRGTNDVSIPINNECIGVGTEYYLCDGAYFALRNDGKLVFSAQTNAGPNRTVKARLGFTLNLTLGEAF